jgi:hypothetical protein
MNTPELVAEVERLVADRDAHANVIAEVKATAAAALKVEGATTFTLLDLVQELAAQRGNAVRENKMMDTALKAVAQAIGLQAAEPLVSKVEAVVAERDAARAELQQWRRQAERAEAYLASLKATAASTVGLAEDVARVLRETREVAATLRASASHPSLRRVLLDALNLGATSASNLELAEGLAKVLKDGRERWEANDAAMMAWQLRASRMHATLASAVDPSIKWSGGAVLPTEQENEALCRRAAIARGVFAPNEALTVALRQQGLTGPLDQCVLALCRDVAGIKAERDAAIKARAEAAAALTTMESKHQHVVHEVSVLRSDLAVSRDRSKRLKEHRDRLANKLALLALEGVNMKLPPPVDG